MEEETVDKVQEVQAEEAEKAQEIPPIPYADLQKNVIDCFRIVRDTVRQTKEKDANVYKLNAELQAYRSGYNRQLFKTPAQYLINYREDYAKALRDLEKFGADKDALLKNAGYVAEDFATMLENIGVESTEEGIRFNGKSVDTAPAQVQVFVPEEATAAVEEQAEEPPAVQTQEELIAFWNGKLNEIKALLADNAKIDKVVGQYVQQSALIERGEQQIVLYPMIRALVSLGKELQRDADAVAGLESEEEVLAAYRALLHKVSEKTEAALALCGITVENALANGDGYDPKKHRILKLLPTDDAALGGKIANVYSDAYIWEEKVFFPAKIDAYRAK